MHHTTEVLQAGLPSTNFSHPQDGSAFRDFVSEAYGSDITPSLLHAVLIQKILRFHTNPLLVTKSSLMVRGDELAEHTPISLTA